MVDRVVITKQMDRRGDGISGMNNFVLWNGRKCKCLRFVPSKTEVNRQDHNMSKMIIVEKNDEWK